MKKLLIFFMTLVLLVLSACTTNQAFTLTSNELNLEYGETSFLPLILNNKTLISDIDIVVENEEIVMIDDLTIVALKLGSTKINFKYKNIESELLVNVSKVLPVLTFNGDYLEMGKSSKISVINYRVEDFNWTVDHPEIANLNDFYVLNAYKLGAVTISIVHKTEEQLKASLTIQIVPPKPSLYTSAEVLEPGDKSKALISDIFNNDPKDYLWEISNPNIIKLDSEFNFIAIKEGSASVSITSIAYPLVSTTLELTVQKAQTFTNEITEGPIFIKALNSTGVVQAGESLDISVLGLQNPYNYYFLSADPTIVAVTDMGIVYGFREGFAKIHIVSKANPQIRGSLTVTVVGTPNVDYVARILAAALGEEGYVAGTNKSNKYGEWFQYNNMDWCAMFVSWSANQAGIGIDVIPKYSTVDFGKLFFETRGLFEYKENYIPKAGDIIFFTSAGASHTGLVVSSDGKKVYTIEGNTSSSVRQRSYDLNYKTITGYGLPDYPPFTN